ncbi:hypothetical protein L873DRAFT_1809572 [Choiromyces venosus 120613-1]|uniref:Uncharacterized protein n=1 Tax=Choiromyces venosus 120613-1 TaxID=1336337 RepID=A0A3N4JGY2_9PEZI|nr:hypothetical protein L873DRAFT_1809572 [Choiromyces venosus 120613-1]
MADARKTECALHTPEELQVRYGLLTCLSVCSIVSQWLALWYEWQQGGRNQRRNVL